MKAGSTTHVVLVTGLATALAAGPAQAGLLDKLDKLKKKAEEKAVEVLGKVGEIEKRGGEVVQDAKETERRAEEALEGAKAEAERRAAEVVSEAGAAAGQALSLRDLVTVATEAVNDAVGASSAAERGEPGAQAGNANETGPRASAGNRRAAPLELVALSDRALPGLREGERLLSFAETAIGDRGHVAFSAIFSTPEGGASYGLWAGSPNGLRLVARAGQPAPGILPTTRMQLFERLRWDREGNLIFVASGIAVYRSRGEGLELVLAAEHLQTQERTVPSGNITSVRIGRDGALVYVRGESEVWAGRPQHLRGIASAGQSPPGMQGLSFAAQTFGPLHAAGDYAVFQAAVDGPGVQALGFGAFGIWLAGPEGLERITCPGASPTSLVSPRPQALSARGELLVSCDTQMLVGRPTSLVPITLGDGSTARAVLAGFLEGDRIFLRDAQRVHVGSRDALETHSLRVRFVGPSGTFAIAGAPDRQRDQGIWIWESGRWRSVIRPGQSVTIADGDVRKVAAIHYHPTGGADAYHSEVTAPVINRDGRTVFVLHFAPQAGVRDATTGLFVGEPGRS